MIEENIKTVLENIKDACKRAGRNKDSVTLIAVSKTMPVEDLCSAYDAGMRCFGENKVQELCDKYDKLPKDINWHMIGHLQRNKVKSLIGKTVLIHSVDSLRLAQQIQEEAQKKEVTVDILLEINAAEEDTKFGLKMEETEALARQVALMKNIRLRGLMTVAPYTENPENNRPYFKKMYQLLVDINKKNIDNVSMDILSMGMTGDYEVAIEEGATMVRVGTGIFGRRNYNI